MAQIEQELFDTLHTVLSIAIDKAGGSLTFTEAEFIRESMKVRQLCREYKPNGEITFWLKDLSGYGLSRR